MVQSPDGTVIFRLFQKEQQLTFNITFHGKTITTSSPIVISLDGISITKNISIKKVDRYKISETYPWQGVHSTAINNCNGAKITVSGKQNYTTDVRVFNDGAAFRLILPGKENENRIPSETTVFNLPSKSTAWYHDLNMHYESVHEKKLIDSVSAGTWLAPPATFKLPHEVYIAVYHLYLP